MCDHVLIIPAYYADDNEYIRWGTIPQDLGHLRIINKTPVHVYLEISEEELVLYKLRNTSGEYIHMPLDEYVP